MSKPKLTDADYQEAATRIGCAVAAVKAVAEVEAPQGGFFEDGRPRILFEGHIFSRRTGGKYDKSHPTISYSKWTRKHYLGGEAEHDRLSVAASLNRSAALMAASWGKFQLMGFNFALCGFSTLQAFINAMYRSERDQLLAFIEYIRQSRLDDEMRDRRWADFARRYNGPDYLINKYDSKLARAFEKYNK